MDDLFDIAGVEKPKEVESKPAKRRERIVRPEPKQYKPPAKVENKKARSYKGKPLIVDLNAREQRLYRFMSNGFKKPLEFKYKDAVVEVKRISLDAILGDDESIKFRYASLTAKKEFVEIGRNDKCRTFLTLF